MRSVKEWCITAVVFVRSAVVGIARDVGVQTSVRGANVEIVVMSEKVGCVRTAMQRTTILKSSAKFAKAGNATLAIHPTSTARNFAENVIARGHSEHR